LYVLRSLNFKLPTTNIQERTLPSLPHGLRLTPPWAGKTFVFIIFPRGLCPRLLCYGLTALYENGDVLAPSLHSSVAVF